MDKNLLREWMDAYFHLHFDGEGQVNCDSLVTAAASQFNHPEWLQGQDNVAWAVAVAVADEWEEFYAIPWWDSGWNERIAAL